jgi:Ras-related protein Rab-1A
MEEEDSGYYDLKFKIIVIGESRVGKTSLIKRYTKDQFGGVYLTTVGIDFQDKTIEIEDKKVKLQVWDTAGQERFRNVAKNYFQSSNGFLLVFDITDKESFQKLNDFWMDQLNMHAPKKAKSVLVGNKSDLAGQRQVSIEDAEEFAKNNNLKYYEVSAKEGTKVVELFFYLANEIYQSHTYEENNYNKNITLKKEKSKKKDKKKCC